MKSVGTYNIRCFFALITLILTLTAPYLYAYRNYKIPEEIYFADARIPLESYDVRERIQKLFNTLLNDRRGFIKNLLASENNYIPYASEILDTYGIHPDFAYIIPVESEFNPRALSPAGASGPWQLMPATGRMYGLRVDNFIDERNLIDRSSAAAAEHLNMLSKLFNNDPFLMLAAYNNGDSNVRSSLESQRSKCFWDIRSNFETESYVEKVVVYKMILSEPKKFGFSVPEKDRRSDYETFTVSLGPEDLYFSDISSVLNISYRQFYNANPHIKFGSYKTGGYISRYTSVEITVPGGAAEHLEYALRERNIILSRKNDFIVEEKIPELIAFHQVMLNENIESIAFKYGADWRKISYLNDLEIIKLNSGSETAKIYPGQTLRIVR